MQCEEAVRDQLAEKYVASRLQEPQLEQFEIHILECSRCRRQVEVLQGLQEELALRPAQLPATRGWLFAWPRWAWSAAAALLVIGAGSIWLQQRQLAPPSATTTAQAPAMPPVSPSAETTPEQASTSSHLATSQPKRALSAGKKGSSTPVATAVDVAGQPPSALDGGTGQAVALDVQGPGGEEADAAQAASAPAPPTTAPGQMPHELAAELFRLGQADPPPYTFAGFSSAGKSDPGLRPGSGMGVTPPSGQAGYRQVFANAMAAYIEGRFGDARPLLEQAVEAEPAAPDASFFLGVCHLQLGRPKEASTQFLRAIQLGPSLYLESAHFYLAKAHIQRNQLAEAEEELQAVLAGQGRRSAEADALLVRLRALRTALQEARTAPRTGQPPR